LTFAKKRYEIGSGCCHIKQPRLSTIALWIALAIDALCVLIWMEAMNHDSYNNTLIWILENTPYALCSYVIIILSIAAFVFLLGRMYSAVALGNSLFLLMGIIQRFKLQLRGDPIKLTDTAMIKEAAQAAMKYLGGGIQLTEMMLHSILLMSICVPLLFLGVHVMKNKPIRRMLAFAAVVCALIGCIRVFPSLEFKCLLSWEDHWQRGLLISFFDTSIVMVEPEGYDEQRVLELLQDYEQNRNIPDQLPHVLFVMSESLFDLSHDLKLSEDPMSYFKELQNDYWGGNHLSSVYGGGTSSVEYEVLTGYRVSDTNGSAYAADIGVIKPGMKTLVSQFSSYGYFTQAIHPNTGLFYNRNTAYKVLGFDDMLFSESLPPAPKEVFPFPSDDYLFDQIIRAFENRPDGKPWFCYTITYQNHGGYSFESDLSDVRIEMQLDDEEMLNARNFVNLVKLSDEALRKLIAYFDALEEPVVIVIFGDHAPTVSQFGIELPQDRMERMHYQTTPLLVYSNYGLDVTSLPKSIPSYRLGAQILRLIGLNGDGYLNYVGSDDAVSLTHFDGMIDCDGTLIVDPERYELEEKRLRLLHYDRVFGKNYGE